MAAATMMLAATIAAPAQTYRVLYSFTGGADGGNPIAVPLEEVSRLLGHASIRTTERHYAPWVMTSRQDRLDDLVMATWKSPKA